jgi:hypothetical protein
LNTLTSVACTGPNACTAVGNDLNASAVGAVLVERYGN